MDKIPNRPKSKPSRRWIFVVVLGGLFLYLIGPFLKPLLMGAILAIVLNPAYQAFNRRSRFHRMNALGVTSLFTLFFLVPLGWLIYAGVKEALEQLKSISSGLDGGSASEAALRWLYETRIIAKINEIFPLSYEQALDLLNRAASTGGTELAGILQGLVTGLPDLLIDTTVALVTIYFCLVDGPRIVLFMRQTSLFSSGRTNEIIHYTRAICNSVILASIVSGLGQAAIISIGCLITKTPNTVLVAFMTFVASFIPVVGTGPVTAGLVIYHLATENITGSIVILAFGLAAGIADNFIRPLTIKDSAEMHPLIAFISAFGGLFVVGPTGLFFGPIVAGLFLKVLPLVLGRRDEIIQSRVP